MKNRQFVVLCLLIIICFCLLYFKSDINLDSEIYDKVDIINMKVDNTKNLINELVENQDYLEFITNNKKEL